MDYLEDIKRLPRRYPRYGFFIIDQSGNACYALGHPLMDAFGDCFNMSPVMAEEFSEEVPEHLFSKC